MRTNININNNYINSINVLFPLYKGNVICSHGIGKQGNIPDKRKIRIRE